MVQIIQERRNPRTSEKFAAAFQQAAQQIPEMYQKHQMQQEQMRSQGMNREAVKKLTGLDLEDPEMQKIALQQGFQGQIRGQEAQMKAQEAAQKLQNEKIEKFAPIQAGLETINQMRNLRQKGNLGFGSGYLGLINADTRRDRGEYSQLGKSLIQMATTIPIRNKLEFETLAESLYDPDITDAEAEGVLNAMEQILTRSAREMQMTGSVGAQDQSMPFESPPSKSIGKPRPFTSFIGTKKKSNFDLEGALEEGYSDDQVLEFLSEKNPDFDTEGALEEGYSPAEINQFLASYKPKKGKLEKGARIGAQLALGAAESAALPYEIAVAPLASKEAQTAAYREEVGNDIEMLLEKKAMGEWDQQDQELLDSLMGQMQNASKAEDFVQTADLSLRGLSEKATGQDLRPEGALEKAANWMGFLKSPKKLGELAKQGINLKSISKYIAPTGTELARGLGAGVALEAAEDGDFGPIGTLSAAVIGDLAGAGIAKGIKGATAFFRNPKQAIAEVAAAFTPKDKKELQKAIIQEFREAGMQADIGTITGKPLIQAMQARLAQSGLTGEALAKFRDELTNSVKGEYKAVAEELGKARFSTNFEAGSVVQETMKTIRDKDLAEARDFYTKARESLKKDSFVPSERLAKKIEDLEKSLKPGQVKGGEQAKVLEVLENLKRDLYDSSGKLMYADVKDLMNNKIALNDIINYEVQGGTKQLLKGVVADIDRAIISHGKNNPSFAKNYILANKKFSEHAKTFRNKAVNSYLQAHDPGTILSKMNSVRGIRDLQRILGKTAEGKQLFQDLKRFKLDQVIGNNMVDSVSQQLKLGTFAKLLEKGKNREVIKEILGPDSMKRLERLQKNAGRLAEANQKFFNASQSAVAGIDAGIVVKMLSDFGHLLYGNPYPLIKTGGGLFGARKLAELMADPNFLKTVEEAILAAEKTSDPRKLNQYIEMLRPYARLLAEEEESSSNPK